MTSNIKMYINAKWTVVKENNIKNTAKNASVVFEEWKMQNKYNSIHCWRNMSLLHKQTASPFSLPAKLRAKNMFLQR